MFTKKLTDIVRRQNELTTKLVAGKLDEAGKKELEGLTRAIDVATGKSKTEPRKTRLDTMTLGEFQKQVDEQSAKLQENPDAAAIELLKRNLESVKAQGKTKAEDIVAIEVPVEMSAEDKLAEVETRLADTEARLKAIENPEPEDDGEGGEGSGGGDGAPSSKQGDKPTATALANEALDSIIERFQSIKERLGSGEEITADELEKMWPGWELREMIEGALGVLSKMEQAKALLDEIVPELKKMEKKTPDEAGKGDGESGDDDSYGKGTEKGNKPGSWWARGDLSPRSKSQVGDFQAVRQAAEKRRAAEQ